MAWEKEDGDQPTAAELSPAPQYPCLPHLIPASQGKRNFLPAVNKSALSPPHWGDGSGSHHPAQKQTRVTRDVECGWATFPWSFVFKAGVGNDGEFARIGGTAHLLQEVSEYTVILVLEPSLLSGQLLPTAAAGHRRGRGVFPLSLYAAVFGLTTGLYHARVHVVGWGGGRNFPECLEKPETLNGFQGLLMWPVQEIAVRQ